MKEWDSWEEGPVKSCNTREELCINSLRVAGEFVKRSEVRSVFFLIGFIVKRTQH
jgi:hypothetical protein